VQQSKLVHHFKGRGMDGIAAEITQEIPMLLKHKNRHTRARQQEAKHHPGGTTAGDTAGSFDLTHRGSLKLERALEGEYGTGASRNGITIPIPFTPQARRTSMCA